MYDTSEGVAVLGEGRHLYKRSEQDRATLVLSNHLPPLGVIAEAAVVADIMYTYLNNYKRTGSSEEDRAAKAMASVLIVTPHHIQRRAVSNRLEAVLEHMDHMDVNNMFVSTAEKAQGKTSMLVVVCYTVLSEAHLEKDAAFLLKHSRLNVALSRARSMCSLVVLPRAQPTPI